MKKNTLNNIMDKAQTICAHSGGRLTEKRKKLLQLLVESKVPLSAYDIAEAYNAQAPASMPTMSVYRILEFLESEQLVHKLQSANKYVACAHIACDHAHEVPQFLICERCQAVKEIGIPGSIIEGLKAQVQKADYILQTPQLELKCLCRACAKKAA